MWEKFLVSPLRPRLSVNSLEWQRLEVRPGTFAEIREIRPEAVLALTWVRTHDWDVSAWRTRSACLDSDPDVFFPIGSSGPAIEQIETARRICAACAVNVECLDFALATNQEAGIWGGTTEEERRKLRKAWLAKQRMVAS